MKSFYDYEKSQIGPYKLPIQIGYVEEAGSYNSFNTYLYYQAMVVDENALAVFNVNNYCLAVLTRQGVYEIAATPTPKLDLCTWQFKEPLKLPLYKHIGFEKTYHNCLAVSQLPTFLIQEVNTPNAVGFSSKLEGVPLENPPFSLYKELLKTDADAIYFDSSTQSPKLLYK